MSTTPKTLGQLIQEKTQAQLNEEAGGTTIQEFENAPVGATATTPDGKRAVKTFNTTSPWRTEIDDWHGYTMSNTNMAAAGYTLDPEAHTDLTTADQQLQNLALWTVPGLVEALAHGRVHIAPGHDPALTAPTSAQEAFELAWNLAYPVKEGQVIPAGTRYLQWVEGNLREYTEHLGITVTKGKSILARTVDPLPDPEPDWLDAPAVLATHKSWHDHPNPTVWTKDTFDSDRWETGLISAHWTDLTDVTPLHPKEDTLHDAPKYRTFSFRDDRPWGTRLGGDPA